MTKHIHPGGPALHAAFSFSGEKLSSVFLELREAAKGTTWEIFSSLRLPEQEEKIHHWMEQYCKGEPPQEEISLDFSSQSLWTQWVLKELEHIPFGSFLTYRGVAIKLGRPSAARAVGSACGRNPFPLLIGCHRVLSSNPLRLLGGFSCGLEIKKRLLLHEGIAF